MQELMIKLKLTINEENGKIEIIKQQLEDIVSISNPEENGYLVAKGLTHKLKENEVKYGYVAFGSRLVDNYPLIFRHGIKVIINCKSSGKKYYGRLHNTTKGRLDGLTLMMRSEKNIFVEGNIIIYEVTAKLQNNIIELFILN